MMEQLVVRSAADLWQDYLFLTREMSKFLARKEYDLFFELMSQREKIQEMLDQVDDPLKKTAEGQAVINTIRQENQQLIAHLRLAMNQMQQQHTVANSYDGGMPRAGRSFDHQG